MQQFHRRTFFLYDYMNTEGNDVPFNSAIHILKRKLFLSNYEPSPWVPGREDDTKDCLKSLMALY